MTISFDNALGIHADALLYRSRRAEVLANNLANADTPNYKARDLDFAAVLAASEKPGITTQRTHRHHIEAGAGRAEEGLRYRVPLQPSIDGNTVEAQEEFARYARNALDFQASFQFLNTKFVALKSAIRGEV